MKTKLIAIGLIAGMLASGQNVRAATPSQRSARTATFTHRHRAVETQQQPVELRPEVTGVIPRAIRGGHPFQVLNPFAPAKYGTAEQNVVLDPDVPGKADGIKLFSFSF
jgi:hypothetical protein